MTRRHQADLRKKIIRFEESFLFEIKRDFIHILLHE